jgi:hypothetical protein
MEEKNELKNEWQGEWETNERKKWEIEGMNLDYIKI